MPSKYNRSTTLSISVLRAFDCPFAGWFTYLSGAERPSSDDLDRGTAAHLMMAHVCERGGLWSEIVGAFTAPLSMYGRDDAADIIAAIEAMFFLRDHTVLGPATDALIEKTFTLRADGTPIKRTNKGGPPPALGATLDLVWFEDDGRRAVLVDWKTNRQPEFNEDVAADDQMRAYGWIICQFYPRVEIVELRKVYLRHVWGDRYAHATLPRDAFDGVWSELAQRANPILAGIAKWEAGAEPVVAFPCRPTAYCAWCPASDQCPHRNMLARTAFDAGLSDSPKLNLSALDGLSIDQLAALSKMLDPLKAEVRRRLKAHVDEHGAVQLGDKELTYYETSKSDPDVVALIKALRKFGLSTEQILDDFVKPRLAAVKKLATRSKDDTPDDRTRKAALKEDIDAAVVKIPSVNFGWTVAK